MSSRGPLQPKFFTVCITKSTQLCRQRFLPAGNQTSGARTGGTLGQGGGNLLKTLRNFLAEQGADFQNLLPWVKEADRINRSSNNK